MAIPSEGYFKLEQGRYGPIYPQTPACHGFSVVGKVKPGREQAIRDYGKKIEEAVKGSPDVLAPLKLHYLRWILFDVGSGLHFTLAIIRQVLLRDVGSDTVVGHQRHVTGVGVEINSKAVTRGIVRAKASVRSGEERSRLPELAERRNAGDVQMVLPLAAIQVLIERGAHAETASRHDALYCDVHRARGEEIREPGVEIRPRGTDQETIDVAGVAVVEEGAGL